MKIFGYDIKIQKRQTTPWLASQSEWIPFSNNFPPTSATRLATVGRCLRLYSDFLSEVPLAPKDHYLTTLLDQPNNWQTKKNFFDALAFEVLMNGNFFAKIEYNNRGQVTGLLPYRSGQIYCYPTAGEYSDPISLQKQGYYYRDFKGRVFLKDDIFHLKDTMFSQTDQVNGLSRVYLYSVLFSAGASVETVQQSLSASGLRPSWLLSGLPEDDSDNIKKVRATIKRFFKSGQSNQSGSVLSLPEGFELKQLTLNNPQEALSFLASKSDLDIARIFSVPIEMISRSDGEMSEGTNHLKEATRFFIKNSLGAFLKNISDSLTALAMDGTQFSFEVDRFRASDLREQSQYISQLVQSAVLTAQEAKKLI